MFPKPSRSSKQAKSEKPSQPRRAKRHMTTQGNVASQERKSLGKNNGNLNTLWSGDNNPINNIIASIPVMIPILVNKRSQRDCPSVRC